MRIVAIRRLGNCSKVPLQKFSRVGSVLQSESDIRNVLNAPSWTVKELIQDNQQAMEEIHVDSGTIRKMLKLSGLETNVTPEQEKKLVQALKSQMVFIQHLYRDNDTDRKDKEENNDSHFRLIASDHKPGEPLTLKSLMEQIKELPQQVDPEKGETEGSFSLQDLDPKHKSFVTILSNRG
ncbi:uncharacterized protein RJT20DRAFT_37888 [Scheffersomyces xylosifermentans]|uniref:uncharacterized protein n=1 Tax=Scheffersomyces xylosifermentans TaxID=1304137 RepID=UPI00315CAFE1